MYHFRLRIILVFLALIFAAPFFRLVQLQIIDSDYYRGRGEAKRIPPPTLIDTLRGNIYDRNKTPLAISKIRNDVSMKYAYIYFSDLYASRKGFDKRDEKWVMREAKQLEMSGGELLESIDHSLVQLAAVSGVGESQLRERLRQIVGKVLDLKRYLDKQHGGRGPKRLAEEVAYHPILYDVAFPTVADIELFPKQYPGIKIETNAVRSYPQQWAACHTLGHIGRASEKDLTRNRQEYDGAVGRKLLRGDIVGKGGIEKFYDTIIRGSRGERLIEVNAFGSEQKELWKVEPIAGRDIMLSLDSRIQKAAEDALGQRKGAVVVMDPRNGEILAMASYPVYDPNSLVPPVSEETVKNVIRSKEARLFNRAVSGRYPVGSVFKIITAAAALEEKRISTSSTFTCNGTYVRGRLRKACLSQYGHGAISLQKALEKSCNIYFYNCGQKVGKEKLWLWARRFGLGEKTGIDLPGEFKGDLPKPQVLSDVIHLSIGQSMSVTPLQAAQLISAIANDGIIAKPHLRRLKNSTIPRRRIEGLSRETIRIIKRGLASVVDSGTARNKGLDRFDAAGKTGTAEVKGKKDHAWFVCYAPRNDPKVALAVVVEHAGHGGAVAAPVASKILEAFFSPDN